MLWRGTAETPKPRNLEIKHSVLLIHMQPSLACSLPRPHPNPNPHPPHPTPHTHPYTVTRTHARTCTMSGTHFLASPSSTMHSLPRHVHACAHTAVAAAAAAPAAAGPACTHTCRMESWTHTCIRYIHPHGVRRRASPPSLPLIATQPATTCAPCNTACSTRRHHTYACVSPTHPPVRRPTPNTRPHLQHAPGSSPSSSASSCSSWRRRRPPAAAGHAGECLHLDCGAARHRPQLPQHRHLAQREQRQLRAGGLAGGLREGVGGVEGGGCGEFYVPAQTKPNQGGRGEGKAAGTGRGE